MRFRLKAFGLHLSASATLLTLILGSLYLGWYRWPGWYLTGVVRILVIVGIVDLALGPTLTLLIANPRHIRTASCRSGGSTRQHQVKSSRSFNTSVRHARRWSGFGTSRSCSG